MELFNSLPEILYLGFYHPLDNHENEYFNEEYRDTILNLKKGHSEAIKFFKKKLCNLGDFITNEPISVTIVPSHSSFSCSSGIRDLAQVFVKSQKGFIDATLCLERFITIPKLSSSDSPRNIDIHLNSIRVNHQELIKDKKVLLFDDVLTTGNSVKACKQLLLESGAKEVKIIVLGKTIRNVEDSHYLIDEKLKNDVEENNMKTDFSLEELEKETNYPLEILSNEIKQRHEEVDEWAYEEHYNLDAEEYHDYIEQEAQKQHQLINQDEYESSRHIVLENNKGIRSLIL